MLSLRPLLGLVHLALEGAEVGDPEQPVGKDSNEDIEDDKSEQNAEVPRSVLAYSTARTKRR